MLNALLAVPLERIGSKLLSSDKVDFAAPPGEAAVVGPDSVSWRVFANPVSMYVGGITAVLLELADSKVRHGVWDHSSFRRDPVGRLRRTGMAAMVTVYGARSTFEALAARVNALHARIGGTTDAGERYRADDPDLLAWVQATAAFAFLAAYRAYVRPVDLADRDLYYAEGGAGAALYGVEQPPASSAELAALFDRMRPRLEPSPVLHELLQILRVAPILPPSLRPVQRSVVRAAVDLMPPDIRRRIGIERHGRLSLPERVMLKGMAQAAERVPIRSSPAAQASVRLGLPWDHLWTREARERGKEGSSSPRSS